MAEAIKAAVLPLCSVQKSRQIRGVSFSGDSTFQIDTLAEDTLHKTLTDCGFPLAYFSEDRGIVKLSADPRWLLVVDPIDGTRPLLCGFEMGVVSIAVAPYTQEESRFGDIVAAVVCPLRVPGYWYAEKGNGVRLAGNKRFTPVSARTEKLEEMFWSFEVVGRPVSYVMAYLGGLIETSGMRAGVFLFNNAAFSLLKVVQGHLDAYVDVGGRILEDFPMSEADFLRIAQGRVMGTFPYDIAAAFLILQEAGAIITDAHGCKLDDRVLTATGRDAILSCVACGNATLHQKIVEKLNEVTEKNTNSVI